MIEKLAFGNTGHLSTRTLFGGAGLKACSQAEADRVLDLLLEHGVNHIDTAATYGESELRIGPWMAQHRAKFFLATKTRERSYQKAKDQIHLSLERLRVDHVDLLQLHNLVDPPDWHVAMGPGGALEAAIEAREQGLTRFIGVTGHGTGAPRVHKQSLERFPFDSVLLPYNYVMMQNPQYRADFEALVALCQERKVAVQTIKSIARAPWGDKTPTHDTWYEPLEDQASIDHAVHWVLSRPGVFLNTVGDTHLLPKVLDAASRFQAGPSQPEMERDISGRGITPLFL
ncbi:MAG TPA: aldo/keto reductase [bacterium]|nr:aldo/keto reductase [bacterium]